MLQTRHRCFLLLAVTSALGLLPSSATAQRYQALVTVGYSTPAPDPVAGEYGRDRRYMVAAEDGGVFVSAGVERAGDVGVRVEALFSRHSSAEWQPVAQRGNELAFLAEQEETAGVMASLMVPVLGRGGTQLRVAPAAGVLRTEMRGFITVGGDAGMIDTVSNTAPALGAGLELSTGVLGPDVMLFARGAQLVSRHRGGGQFAVGAGVRFF